MPLAEDNEIKPALRTSLTRTNIRQQFINQFINLFWTGLCFAPVLWFWIGNGVNTWLYLFLGISLTTAVLPAKVLDRLRLSSDRKLYERCDVKTIRKFVQNGDLSNKIGGNRSGKTITGSIQAQQYLKTVAMYERFHWICFVFFLFTGVYGFLNQNIWASIWIFLANILYNVSAIMLQQYNKIRIRKLGLTNLKY